VLEDRTLLSAGPISPTTSAAPLDQTAQIASVPNDPSFSVQWGLNNTSNQAADINAPQAWNVTRGSTRMIVSVMDTGIDYRHPDLYLNIWLNRGEIPASRLKNLIDIDGDGLITFRDLNDKRNQGIGKIMDLDGDGRITGADILKPMIKNSAGADTGNGGWADGSDQDHDGQHPPHGHQRARHARRRHHRRGGRQWHRRRGRQQLHTDDAHPLHVR
jgi:hypothetical protein